MAGTKIRIICLISFISLTFRRKSMPEAALNDVGPVTFCSTKPGVIPWSYDDADNIDLVIWTKGTTQVMYNTTGILQINDPKFELDTNTNAGLKVLTVESSSVGSTYTCSVGYKVGTSIPDQKVITPTVVTNFPAGLAGTCVNSGSSLKCNCSVTDLGLPTAVLKIKVNNHTIMNTTQNFLEEVVTDTSVQCCMEGDGVKCINEDGAKEACLSVTVPECKKCCRRVICYVGVFVNIPLAIAILILYCIIICFKKRILEKIGSIAFCCIIILPALCSMALGIGLAVGLCVGNCKESAQTECGECDNDDSYLVLDTILGAVLVIICNPCCSVGIILIHWKCFRGKTATDCNNDDHDDHNHHAGIKMQSKDAGNRHVNAGGQDQSENTNGKYDASKTAKLAHL